MDLLDVDDYWEDIKDVPWDSGYTPRQVVKCITMGECPTQAEYDVKLVKHFVRQFKLYRNDLDRWPVEVDHDRDIVDGFHRLTAAKILNIGMFPYRQI